MKLRPLDDRVVIKQSEPEEKTAGGIILPEKALDPVDTVVVLEIKEK